MQLISITRPEFKTQENQSVLVAQRLSSGSLQERSRFKSRQKSFGVQNYEQFSGFPVNLFTNSPANPTDVKQYWQQKKKW